MPAVETTRPSPDLISQAYKNIFQAHTTLSKLHDAAINNRLFASSNSSGVPGRSLAWKVFLLQKEPLEDHPPSPPFSILHRTRKDYVDLVTEKFRAPDGTYEDGFVLPGSNAAPPRPTSPNINLNTHNPLSLSDENPWKVYFANVDLRKTIRQDVERTFPDMAYFRDARVQRELIDILFVYTLTHPKTGYRQGMHEILASLYFVVDYDSLEDTDESSVDETDILDLCSRTWVAADAWALFEAVMQNLSRWYEWRDRAPTPEVKTIQLPIIGACKKMQHDILRSVDPVLWRSLEDTGIEPQLYGIRWLRLLFTREFPMSEVYFLWDALFACDVTFDLAVWVGVAMLIRIRNELIPGDYSTQLSCLLRYPSPPDLPESAPPVNPYMLLLKQAITLRTSPTAATGASTMIENRNLLNIPLEVPDPPPVMSRRQGRGRPPFATAGRAGGEGVKSQLGHGRQLSSQGGGGLPEFLARNLMERGEGLGLNNIMSAVSELRRNLPEIASSFTRSPPLDDSYTAFPLRDDHRGGGGGGDNRSSAYDSHSRFELERDLTNMRAMNKTLGEAASWILDALKNEDTTNPAVRERREKALGSFSYLRDALQNGSILNLDEEKLFDEESLKIRRMKAPASASPSSSPDTSFHPPLNPRSFMQPLTPLQHSRTPPITSPPDTPPANHHPLVQVPRGKNKFQLGQSLPNTQRISQIQTKGALGPSVIPSSNPPLRRKSDEVPKAKKDSGLDPLGVLH